jgi:hypothetical protein
MIECVTSYDQVLSVAPVQSESSSGVLSQTQLSSSSGVSSTHTNEDQNQLATSKSFDHKTYSIESYEQRFLNSLKQLNAPKWFSMNSSSSQSLASSTAASSKYSYPKYDKDEMIKMLGNKTVSSSAAEPALTSVSSHKLKYERIKQRYRLQKQTKETISSSNGADVLSTTVKIRENSLNKSTRSLTNSLHGNQVYMEEEDPDEDEDRANEKNTNNFNYSKSAYSLNNSQYLSSCASSTTNNAELIIKRSQSSYHNNHNKSNTSITDDPVTGAVKTKPLWLSYSALQNKSSSTINSFGSTLSNWYKPKSLQLPDNIAAAIRKQDASSTNIIGKSF